MYDFMKIFMIMWRLKSFWKNGEKQMSSNSLKGKEVNSTLSRSNSGSGTSANVTSGSNSSNSHNGS